MIINVTSLLWAVLALIFSLLGFMLGAWFAIGASVFLHGVYWIVRAIEKIERPE